MIRPLTHHANSLRLFPEETDSQLLERLKASSRGAPQKPDESEADYFFRLVRNAWMRVYMSESDAGKNALRRAQEKLKRERRISESVIAENARARSRRKHANRAALLVELKSKPCMDCGGTFPSCAMQFDHRDPSTKNKKFPAPGAMLGRASIEAFMEEIAKCDLVCANCHAIRTHMKRPRLVPSASKED